MHSNNRRRAVPRSALTMAAAAALVVAGSLTATAATTDPNPGPLELANAQLSQEAATQGMVLLENHDKALPMPKSGTVAVFGVGAYKTVKGGTGSGDCQQPVHGHRASGTGERRLRGDDQPRLLGRDDQRLRHQVRQGGGGGGFGQSVDYSSVEQLLTPRACSRPRRPTPRCT